LRVSYVTNVAVESMTACTDTFPNRHVSPWCRVSGFGLRVEG